jgi:2-polyprenyl-6-methoxyphenol hydroxylase-like FAD-dependent oxidoreductase
MLVGRDVKVFDFGGWMDECDAGFTVTRLSRPAYEGILLKRVAALPGVSIRQETSVKSFVVTDGKCTGVELEDGETLSADLCVDATGMTGPLMRQLAEDGHAAFETEDVRIYVAYARPGRPDIADKARVLPAGTGKQFSFPLPIEDDQ